MPEAHISYEGPVPGALRFRIPCDPDWDLGPIGAYASVFGPSPEQGGGSYLPHDQPQGKKVGDEIKSLAFDVRASRSGASGAPQGSM